MRTTSCGTSRRPNVQARPASPPDLPPPSRRTEQRGGRTGRQPLHRAPKLAGASRNSSKPPADTEPLKSRLASRPGRSRRTTRRPPHRAHQNPRRRCALICAKELHRDAATPLHDDALDAFGCGTCCWYVSLMGCWIGEAPPQRRQRPSVLPPESGARCVGPAQDGILPPTRSKH